MVTIVKTQKIDPDAIIPAYATSGAGCFDLHAIVPEGSLTIDPQASAIFGTGLAFDIPMGHVMLIFSRSGHGFKHSVRLANCVGVIDSDYRGEVKVRLTHDGHGLGLKVSHGDRIAQAMVIPVPAVYFVEMSELSPTERGTGGFGSTGS